MQICAISHGKFIVARFFFLAFALMTPAFKLKASRIHPKMCRSKGKSRSTWEKIHEKLRIFPVEKEKKKKFISIEIFRIIFLFSFMCRYFYLLIKKCWDHLYIFSLMFIFIFSKIFLEISTFFTTAAYTFETHFETLDRPLLHEIFLSFVTAREWFFSYSHSILIVNIYQK